MRMFRDAHAMFIVRKMAVTVLLAIVFALFLGGCSQPEVRSDQEPLKIGSPARIVVLPFQQIFPEDLQKGAVESPLTGAIFDAAKSPGSPEAVLEEGFLKRLEKNRPAVAVLSGERAAAVFRNVSSSSLKISLRQALSKTAGELGADLVVVGYLYRFRELQGESFAAEKPASVAFELVMLDVADGKVVWRGIFDRTQRSLMENLFQSLSFWKGKGRWMRAEQLASQGLDEMMKTFPSLTSP